MWLQAWRRTGAACWIALALHSTAEWVHRYDTKSAWVACNNVNMQWARNARRTKWSRFVLWVNSCTHVLCANCHGVEIKTGDSLIPAIDWVFLSSVERHCLSACVQWCSLHNAQCTIEIDAIFFFVAVPTEFNEFKWHFDRKDHQHVSIDVRGNTCMQMRARAVLRKCNISISGNIDGAVPRDECPNYIQSSPLSTLRQSQTWCHREIVLKHIHSRSILPHDKTA